MAESDRISVCVIARDEEENLKRCLSSVSGAVAEIVLVDTGSRDATVSIARSFGARVFHHPWTDDFAAARNRALDEATGNWVLVLDADDELSPEARAALPDLVRSTDPAINGYGFTIASWIGRRPGRQVATVVHPRLWRNRPEYRYSGRIHEWVSIGLVIHTGLRIYHYGYLTDFERFRRKAARNMAILNEELRKNPENGYYLAQLGTEYARIGQLPRAAGLYRRAWPLEKMHLVADTYAHCLLRLRRFQKARAVLEEALSLWPDYTDLYYHYGCALIGLGDYTGGRAAIRRCLEMGAPPPDYPAMEGYTGFMGWVQLGHVEVALHNWEAAARASWQALSERSDSGVAFSLLVRSLVALFGPSIALEVLLEQTSMQPSSVRFCARLFAEWACWPQAKALLDRHPDLPLADTLLRADCLMALGQIEAAEAELDRMLAGETEPASPVHKQARKLRALLTWVRGDPAAAAAVIPTGKGDLLNLAEKLLILGRPDLAGQVFEKLEGLGDPVEIAGAAGRLLLRYGRAREAGPHLERALAGWGRRKRELPVVGGGRSDLLVDLGESEVRTERYARAAQAFRSALEQAPSCLSGYLGIAEACLREAGRLMPHRNQNAWHELAGEMCRERRRAEPLYDRQGRGARPGPGAE